MKSKHAHWRRVPYVGLHARQPRKAVVLHTNGGGSGSLFGWFSGNARGDHGAANRHVGAQFQVMRDGKAEQYVDTDDVIYHAYGASEWAVGIETEDDGDPSKPWTPQQIRAIVAICRELGVPGQLLKESASDGVGWHEQYPSWNKTAHACPGKVREKQIREQAIPALRGLTPARRKRLRARLIKARHRVRHLRRLLGRTS